ncbi:sucrase ferredoxin [Actinomycetospora chibensis]|uniref:Sucrase ferredoxin n=1 Tax=Actinomycetospora chibensis TaxID=663606 RepID=A0ABV9RJ33_9PSEU|nr:sucrase ferredoxin [Actinomycetospora chibensis]MDD7926220.1 sucrase ferredoxin [Actinomycetospora chibensis]
MTSPETDAPDASAGFRCSEAARDRDDPFVATAPPARCWLLVEHPGPWGRDALGGAGYPDDVLDAIDAFCRARGARFQLIRRSRSRGEPMADRGRFALVDTTPGAETVRWGRVASPLELPAALADVEAATVASSEPVYLVCAHGRHDACCAMRGRPVAAELAATYPDRTWETTHTGGDRFAANVVLLPHGLVLGRVPATEAVSVVERYAAGEVDTVWVRGRSGFSPPAQAAQHHARLAFGEARVDALRVLGTETREPGVVEVTLDGGSGRGPVSVVVRERWVASPTPLTCSAGRASSMRVFDLVEMTPGAGFSEGPEVRALGAVAGG